MTSTKFNYRSEFNSVFFFFSSVKMGTIPKFLFGTKILWIWFLWTFRAFQILGIPYNNANNPEKRLLLTLVLSVTSTLRIEVLWAMGTREWAGSSWGEKHRKEKYVGPQHVTSQVEGGPWYFLLCLPLLWVPSSRLCLTACLRRCLVTTDCPGCQHAVSSQWENPEVKYPGANHRWKYHFNRQKDCILGSFSLVQAN